MQETFRRGLSAVTVALVFSAATPTSKATPSEFPATYAECAGSMSAPADGNFMCVFTASLENKQVYDQCVKLGGIQLHADPATAPAEYKCSLSYFNPDFVFPEDFKECLGKGGGNYADGRGDFCMIFISPDLTHNKQETQILARRCLAKGGREVGKGGCSFRIDKNWARSLWRAMAAAFGLGKDSVPDTPPSGDLAQQAGEPKKVAFRQVALPPDWRLRESFDYSRYRGILNSETELGKIWRDVVDPKKGAGRPAVPVVDFDKHSVIWYADRGAHASFVEMKGVLEFESAIKARITLFRSDFGSSRLNLWAIPKTRKPIRFVEENARDEGP